MYIFFTQLTVSFLIVYVIYKTFLLHMSCIINISSLTKSEKNMISIDLKITANIVVKTYVKKKFDKPSESFRFYKLDLNPLPPPPHNKSDSTTTNVVSSVGGGGGGFIRVPLSYGIEKFGSRVIIGNKDWIDCSEDLKPSVVMRDDQISVFERATKLMELHGGAIIGSAPGFGKTIVGTMLAYASGYRWAVIVPRETLIDQWVATFTKIFGVGFEDRVLVPGRVRRRRKRGESEQQTPPLHKYDAIVTLDTRVCKISPEDRASIGFLIVDEGHMLCTSSRVDSLLSFTPQFVLVETATLSRDDGAHEMMHLLAGKNTGIFPEYYKAFLGIEQQQQEDGKSAAGVNRNVSEGESGGVLYHVIKYKTGVAIDENFIEINKYETVFDYNHFCKGISESEKMNAAIVDIVVGNPNRKFIILSKLASHVEELMNLLSGSGVDTDIMYRNRRAHRDVRALVGTIQKIGTGYDQKAFCKNDDVIPADTLILTHTVKKWQLFEQIRGRAMRATPGVVPCVVVMLPTNSVSTKHIDGLSEWISKTGGGIFSSNGALRLPVSSSVYN